MTEETRKLFPDSETVTATEISVMAGVGPSAVSNWKKRDPTFPKPYTGNRYLLSHIQKWAKKREVNLNVDVSVIHLNKFWNVIDMLGDSIGPTDSSIFCMQMLVLKQARSDDRLPTLECLEEYAHIFFDAATVNHLEIFKRISTEIIEYNPVLARAFRPSPSLESVEKRLFSLIANSFEEEVTNALIPDSAARHPVLDSIVDRLEKLLQPSPRFAPIFTTSQLTANLAIEILKPLKGFIYDPASGTAHFLRTVPRKQVTKLFGQEINEQVWRFGVLSLVLNQADFDLKLANSLENDQLWNLKADRVFVEPPIGVRPRAIKKPPANVVGQFGNGTWISAWIDHITEHTSDKGRVVMLVPPNFLFSGDQRDITTRMQLVTSGILSSVIQLPTGAYANTAVEGSLLVLDLSTAKENKDVLMIDARGLNNSEGIRGALGNDGITQIGEWVRTVHHETRAGVTALPTAAKIRDESFNIDPRRYIAYDTDFDLDKIAGEEIGDRLKRITSSIASTAANLMPSFINSSNSKDSSKLLSEQRRIFADIDAGLKQMDETILRIEKKQQSITRKLKSHLAKENLLEFQQQLKTDVDKDLDEKKDNLSKQIRELANAVRHSDSYFDVFNRGLKANSGQDDVAFEMDAMGFGFKSVDSPIMESWRLGDLLLTPPIGGVRQLDAKDDEPTLPWIPTSAVTTMATANLVPLSPDSVEDLLSTSRLSVGDRTTLLGDILLARRGLAHGQRAHSKVVDFEIPAAFAQSLVLIRCDTERLLPGYLQIYLSSRRGSAALTSLLTGSVITNISAKALQDVEILVPPVEKQVHIIKIVEEAKRRLLAAQKVVSTSEDFLDALSEVSVSDKYVLHSATDEAYQLIEPKGGGHGK